MKHTWILLALVTVLLAACGGQTPGADMLDLTGTWQLATIGSQKPVEGASVTLTFENGQASGRGGCNSYGGEYTLDGAMIQFGALVQTEMACMEPDGVMEQESIYLQTLSQAASLRQSGDTLEILGSDGQVLLSFNR